MGFLLLNRTPGGITLTKEGQLFAVFAQKVLDEQQIFWRQIENLQPHIDVKQVGVLTLNVFGLYEVCVLPEILKKFCLHYPNVTIHTIAMDQYTIEESFCSSQDNLVGMITLPSAEVEQYSAYLHDRQLVFVPFGEGNYHLCCNRNHPLLNTHGTEISLKAAMQYPLIQYSISNTDDSQNDTLHRLLNQYGYGSKVYNLTVQSLHTWIANLLYSHKIGFLHEFILQDMKNHYDIFRELAILKTKETLSGTLGCIVQKNCSSLVRCFMDFLPELP